MNKHTPAPLSGSELLKRLLERKEEKNENGQFVVINNIKDFSGTTYIRYDAMVFELNQMIKENKLIAAAPELLEAAIKLQEWNQKYPPNKVYDYGKAKAIESELTEIVNMQLEAIKKATE